MSRYQYIYQSFILFAKHRESALFPALRSVSLRVSFLRPPAAWFSGLRRPRALRRASSSRLRPGTPAASVRSVGRVGRGGSRTRDARSSLSGREKRSEKGRNERGSWPYYERSKDATNGAFALRPLRRLPLCHEGWSWSWAVEFKKRGARKRVAVGYVTVAISPQSVQLKLFFAESVQAIYA